LLLRISVSCGAGTMAWGATAQEAGGQVAGDELMPDADIVATRVVEIDAPPAAIWPWLVQMGPGRGGACTYAWIGRRLGIDIRNTDRIIPELQNLKVGDEIPMPGYAMRVERLDPGQVLVIRSSNHAWVWSFELRPVNGRTRLISRNRFDTAALPMRDKQPGITREAGWRQSHPAPGLRGRTVGWRPHGLPRRGQRTGALPGGCSGGEPAAACLCPPVSLAAR